MLVDLPVVTPTLVDLLTYASEPTSGHSHASELLHIAAACTASDGPEVFRNSRVGVTEPPPVGTEGSQACRVVEVKYFP